MKTHGRNVSWEVRNMGLIPMGVLPYYTYTHIPSTPHKHTHQRRERGRKRKEEREEEKEKEREEWRGKKFRDPQTSEEKPLEDTNKFEKG